MYGSYDLIEQCFTIPPPGVLLALIASETFGSGAARDVAVGSSLSPYGARRF